MKKNFIIALTLTVCLSCSRPKTEAPAPDTAAAKSKLTIGWSVASLNNEFFVTMKQGIEDAARDQGVVLLEANANADVAKQVADVEDLLQKGAQIMLLTPQDSEAIVPAVKRCNEKNIPVVVVDIGVSGGQVASLIISDNYQGGRLAGEFIAGKVGPSGKVVHIQCQLGAANAAKRGQGFKDVMKEKGIAVVAEQPADSMKDKGMTVMENILQAEPQIDAVFAQNDNMALGALLAVKNTGKCPPLPIVGFDGNKEALEAIRQGDLAATVIQFPYDMGKTGIETAVKLSKGEIVPAVVAVPVELVTHDNLDRFSEFKRQTPK
jgi:ribose transport system substrate-binding protein